MTTRNIIIAIAVIGVGYLGFRMYKKSQLEDVTKDEDSTVRIFIKK